MQYTAETLWRRGDTSPEDFVGRRYSRRHRLRFDGGIEVPASASPQVVPKPYVNERTENIGARRLATVMERLLDDVSFDAPNRGGQTITLDGAAVDAKLADLAKDVALSRYIL